MKAIDNNISKEELKAIMEEHTKISNEYAISKGFSNYGEMSDKIKSLLTDNSFVNRQAGERIAGQTIYDLALLVLYQEVQSSRDAKYLDFAELFNDGYITEGNSKSYVFDMITGHSNYDKTKFIPESATEQSVKSHIISMFKSSSSAGQVLADNAVQYKKPLTILTPNWVQYFIKNSLNQFLTTLRLNMRKEFKIFKFHKVASFLTSLTNVKTIEGTAKNMFDCFTEEIFPEIEKMNFYSSDYNRDQTFKGIDAAGSENVYLVAHSNILTKLKTGIQSQTYNAKLISLESLLGSDKVISLGNQFVIGDENTPVSVNDTPYVDENTIWVFNKNLIKFLYQINTQASQSFAENLATQLVLHIWFTMDTLPWGQVFKYTNQNLKVLPGNETEAALVKSKK